jgi:hypothetical protein
MTTTPPADPYPDSPLPPAPAASPTTPGYAQPAYARSYAYGPPAVVPAVWPVAVFTLLFGALGAISAFRRSVRARAAGAGVGPYWGTFAGAFIGLLLILVINDWRVAPTT